MINNLQDIKASIGPMSKNIVDSVIEYCEDNCVNIALIPSRRQVEFDGGYVNNWTTKEFSDYVKSKTDRVLLVRDHGGPNQGNDIDDGYESINSDIENMDLIHVDVWKKYDDIDSGIEATIEYIKYCYSKNSDILFEVATEEAIRRFESQEIDYLLKTLKESLGEIFDNIVYCVIQSGTSLSLDNNTGVYSSDRLEEMIKIVDSYGLLSKEHNGDYLTEELVSDKFNLGLDCINIAPEFGRIETETILGELNEDQIEIFYNLCYESKKWVKWVPDDFDPNENKLQIIKISGHYVFSDPKFIEMKKTLDSIPCWLPSIDDRIKVKIKEKIKKLV